MYPGVRLLGAALPAGVPAAERVRARGAVGGLRRAQQARLAPGGAQRAPPPAGARAGLLLQQAALPDREGGQGGAAGGGAVLPHLHTPG